VKIIQASCMAALTLCLAGVALADNLQTVGASDSLGFSARRLERITSWFEAQSEKGDPSGFVVAIARGGKLALFAAHRL
jgi:CubicO group peptidase (beta-lactamase class C family)